MDSAGLLMNYKKIQAYCKINRIEFTYSLGGIQKDNASCSTFALENAFDMSQIEDLHEYLTDIRTPIEKNDYFFQVSPINLPPTLVKNSQSTTFIESYINKHPEYELTAVETTGQSLREYAESHQNLKRGKIFNKAILYKQSQYRAQINIATGNGADLDYEEVLQTLSEKIMVHAMQQIKNIKVNFKLCLSEQAITFVNSHIEMQFTEILKHCAVRDAQAVLNITKASDELSQVIQEKQQEVTHLMNQRLSILKNKQPTQREEIKSEIDLNLISDQSYLSLALQHPELLSAGIGLLIAAAIITTVITCGATRCIWWSYWLNPLLHLVQGY